MANCLDFFRPQRMFRIGSLAQTAALVCLVTSSFATSAQSATVLLDDFENGFNGMNGQLVATGPVLAVPKPGTLLGMRIDQAGLGGCDHLIGDSQALCGADTKKWAGQDGAVLRYDADFSRISTLLFDIAAFSVSDPFDYYGDGDGDTFGDYLRISSLVGGTKSLLAEFTGVPKSDRTPETSYGLVSTDAGALIGKGVSVGANFNTIRLFGLSEHLSGLGSLVFEIRSTGSSEQIGLDNVRFSEVPLPGSIYLSMLGLATFATSARMRRSKRNKPN